jgi:Asp-tRNA(Asn)/Glu-tRNA(Gln) amidotransferase C subunit
MIRAMHMFKAIPKTQIKELINTPTWSVTDLLHHKSIKSDSIDHGTIEKLVKLSGLSYDDSSYPKLISALKEQLSFIDQLHQVELPALDPALEGHRLDLSDLEHEIESQVQDKAKGETIGSWDPMELTTLNSNGQYVIKEGLLKK